MHSQTSKGEVKFTEWRPVGVCDNGTAQERKAKFFRHSDLEVVTAKEINRQNWREHSEVLKVIHRYAKDVAKISATTQSMKHPVVVEIKLVGAVLDYKRTPELNRESEAGRVQLFQVEYADQPSKSYHIWWKGLMAIGLILLIGFGFKIVDQLLSKSQKSYSSLACENERDSPTYKSHLKQAKDQLKNYLKRFPALFKYDAARQICHQSSNSLKKRENYLIQCYREIKKARFSGRSKVDSAIAFSQQCVQQLCNRGLEHLRRVCRF